MSIQALNEIHEEIERLSEERTGVRRRLSAEYASSLVEELHRLDAELDRLWDEHRAVRAALHFGSREAIVARARVEERLERAA
jgi:ABC-type phosphate transport system auxiliary subunit